MCLPFYFLIINKEISSYICAAFAGSALAAETPAVKGEGGEKELTAVEVRAKAEDMSGIAAAGSE